MILESDLAWAAGLFEAEDTIVQTDGRHPRMGLCNTDESVMLHFQAIMGGRLYGPYLSQSRKPIWKWWLSGLGQCRAASSLILPYLGMRRRRRLESVFECPLPEQPFPRLTALAWAAGFFEGEGCITWVGGPTVTVTCTDRDVLDRFNSVVERGSVYGPYPRTPPWKPIYRWIVWGHTHCSLVLNLLWPWLSSRRRDRASEILIDRIYYKRPPQRKSRNDV